MELGRNSGRRTQEVRAELKILAKILIDAEDGWVMMKSETALIPTN